MGFHFFALAFGMTGGPTCISSTEILPKGFRVLISSRLHGHALWVLIGECVYFADEIVNTRAKPRTYMLCCPIYLWSVSICLLVYLFDCSHTHQYDFFIANYGTIFCLIFRINDLCKKKIFIEWNETHK